MAIHVGIGKSKEPDGYQAGVEAITEAFTTGNLSTAQIVLVAATVGYNQKELLSGIRSVAKNVPLVGCSTQGVITQEGPDELLRRVEVLAIDSNTMRFTPVLAKGLKKDSYGAGKEIAEALRRDWPNDAKALMLITDGLSINSDALFRGLEDTLPEKIPFVGGTASETSAFKNTYQYFNDEVMEDAAIGVLLSGDFRFDIGVSHGSQPVGITRTVTKAEGNHIYEIDNKPAFEVFRELLGPQTTDLDFTVVAGVCLGVAMPMEVRGDYEDVILRIPLVLDKTDNSLYMAAEWPVGTEILICRRDEETIVRRAREISEQINKRHPGETPAFALHFDCTGRSKTFLGAEIARSEVASNQATFFDHVPWFGFYTLGEIAPVQGKNYFHNWTSVLFVVYP